MKKRIYRTRKGKEVDMESLRIKHEHTVAAGNMNVTANGDKLSRGGNVEKTSQERVKPYYRNNPKATEKVSLKNPADQTIKVDNEKKSLKNDVSEKTKKATSTKEATKKQKSGKPKEIELEDGSIVIQEANNSSDEE